MPAPDWLILRGTARGLHMAGSFVTFGTLFLAATLLHRYRLPGLRLTAWIGVASIFGLAWFILQTADFASTTTLPAILAATPAVATDTRFGALLIGRTSALLLAVLCFQAGWPRLAAPIALGAVIAESWLGHGGAMAGIIGTILLITSILHLACAAAWLGALPALRLAIACLPTQPAAATARQFSPIGIACVSGLIVTATIQFCLLIASPAALVTTDYGIAALAKILLLLALIALAARNRNRLTPRLPTTRVALLRSIDAEIALGLLALIAAGLILQFAPPAMAVAMDH